MYESMCSRSTNLQNAYNICAGITHTRDVETRNLGNLLNLYNILVIIICRFASECGHNAVRTYKPSNYLIVIIMTVIN